MEIKTKRLLLSPLGPQYVKSAFVYSGDLENTKIYAGSPGRKYRRDPRISQKSRGRMAEGIS